MRLLLLFFPVSTVHSVYMNKYIGMEGEMPVDDFVGMKWLGFGKNDLHLFAILINIEMVRFANSISAFIGFVW